MAMVITSPSCLTRDVLLPDSSVCCVVCVCVCGIRRNGTPQAKKLGKSSRHSQKWQVNPVYYLQEIVAVNHTGIRERPTHVCAHHLILYHPPAYLQIKKLSILLSSSLHLMDCSLQEEYVL